MKIIIEGEVSELHGVLAALLASAEQTQTPKALPEVEVVAEPEVAPVAESVEAPAEPVESTKIIDRVMAYIENHPGATNEVIAEMLGLTVSQAQSATTKLTTQRRIDKMKNRYGRTTLPAHWIDSRIAREGGGITTAMIHFVRLNPRVTSANIAKQTGLPYSKVTSIMSNLMRGERVLVEGRGGINDPFRYTGLPD